MRTPANLFGAIDSLRIPVQYLAELFTAGDVVPVRAALAKLAAMRSYQRDINLGDAPDESIAAAVGMTGAELTAMFRLLGIAKYEDRYVVPTAATGEARALDATFDDGCSLDFQGGPGFGGAGPEWASPGRKTLPLSPIESLHPASTGQER